MSLKCVCNLHDKFFLFGSIPLQENKSGQKRKESFDSSLFLSLPLSFSLCAFELKSLPTNTTTVWIKRSNSTFASIYLSVSNQYFCSLSLERSGNALWNFLDMTMLLLYSCFWMLHVQRADWWEAQLNALFFTFRISAIVAWIFFICSFSWCFQTKQYTFFSLSLSMSFILMILSVFISSFLLWIWWQFSRYFPFKCWIAVDFNSETRVSAIFISCFVEYNIIVWLSPPLSITQFQVFTDGFNQSKCTHQPVRLISLHK